MADEVTDLFGSQLSSPAKAPEPAWQDGVYRVHGVSMKKGVYRSGRWEGRPFARFMFELKFEDGRSQQVSQMLPWLPGKAFFEINFKMLTGLSLSDFTEHCRRQGWNDASSQSRFFLECFRGTEFEVEVRRQDRWFNVWSIKRRIEEPLSAESEAASHSDKEDRPATESAAHSGADRLAGARSAGQAAGLDTEQLEALCQEEFAQALDALDEQNLSMLLQLLDERRRERRAHQPAS